MGTCEDEKSFPLANPDSIVRGKLQLSSRTVKPECSFASRNAQDRTGGCLDGSIEVAWSGIHSTLLAYMHANINTYRS